MDGVMFTVEELERLTVAQMKVLVEYYDIPHKGRKRADYLETLTGYYKAIHGERLVEDMPMSVRIRRIKEQNNVAV